MRDLLRGVAAALGLFTLLNLVGDLLHPGFDASLWWIDLRGFPRPVRLGLLIVSTIAVWHFAVRPSGTLPVRVLRSVPVIWLVSCALRDGFGFYQLHHAGTITAHVPLPFSLAVAVTLLGLLLAMNLGSGIQQVHQQFVRERGHVDGERPVSRRRRWLPSPPLLAGLVTSWIAFPLLQMYCFGWTDYRRPSDAAVVFGCRVFPSGRVSLSLAERVETAVDLYHEGLVSSLIMSGGPGPGDVHETEAMRDLAVRLGVPHDRILIDRHGLSTDETVASTVPMFKDLGVRRVLAVSQFYHLPRIKLAYCRAGWNVFTVPANRGYQLPWTSYQLTREVLALWVYYLRPLWPGTP